MSIDVRELQPGDRVVLNCPKARINAKREARFDGIFNSIDEAMRGPSRHFPAHVLINRNTEEFLKSAGQWARFLLQTAPPRHPEGIHHARRRRAAIAVFFCHDGVLCRVHRRNRRHTARRRRQAHFHRAPHPDRARLNTSLPGFILRAMDFTRATDLTPEVEEAIDDAMDYHKWTDPQITAGGAIRKAIGDAIKAIVAGAPPCPDRSAAIRKLREARMDANSAITHSGKY